MNETNEIAPNWPRLLSRLLICAGVILYATILIYETHSANEPHLWRDMWKDAWFDPDDPGTLIVFPALFFGGFVLLWCSLPAFYHLTPARYKYALFWCGAFAIAFGAFGTVGAIYDFPTDYTFSAGGQGLLAFGVIYSSALLFFGRALPLIPVLFRKTTRIFHRLSILAILLVAFVGFAMGILGSSFSIEMYVNYQYHSG